MQHALPCLLIDILEEACTGLFRDSAAGLVSGTQSPQALEGTCGCDDPAPIAREISYEGRSVPERAV